jgi:hypothetical protein
MNVILVNYGWSRKAETLESRVSILLKTYMWWMFFSVVKCSNVGQDIAAGQNLAQDVLSNIKSSHCFKIYSESEELSWLVPLLSQIVTKRYMEIRARHWMILSTRSLRALRSAVVTRKHSIELFNTQTMAVRSPLHFCCSPVQIPRNTKR